MLWRPPLPLCLGGRLLGDHMSSDDGYVYDGSVGKMQERVESCFLSAFGRTPLRARLEDIERECQELLKYTDLKNLKEETGDLLASLLQLCNENGWEADHLVLDTILKIHRREKQYHSLGRKHKIALLGGAFDPPTIGHIKLAQFVLNASRTFDEAWLVPCFKHLYNKEMVDSGLRYEMCELAAEADGRIKVFDYEIRNKLGGETYNFVNRLLEEDFAKDKYDFSYIIGLDNANSFHNWVNFEDLERRIRFVVVSRKGIKRDESVDWYLKPPHIFLAAEEEIPEISSTIIRNAIRSNHDDGNGLLSFFEKYLDLKVYEYIKKNRLYREGE